MLRILRPTSLEEAIRLLVEDPTSQPLGGGTAIQILRKQGLLAPGSLVDLSLIPDMRAVQRDEGGGLRIGAMATHREVEQSDIVGASAPLLRETYRQVANIRVRHTATVGGNLAHGDYRSDPPAALLVLDASIVTAGPDGARCIPIQEFFVDLQQTALAPGELIREVRVPTHHALWSAAYTKFSSLAANDWPCVGIAVLVDWDSSGRVTGARLGVAALASTPLLVTLDGLAGATEHELTDAAVTAVLQAIDPIPDVRGSVEYKQRVCAVVVRDTVSAAYSAQRQAVVG
jgi:carbon-monoxide dehydrogenase medium subunit